MSPGHIPPLRAVSGGSLALHGRAEAAVDVVRLSGSGPAAAICDVLTDDGELADAGTVGRMAVRLGLAQVTIAEVMSARLEEWAGQ